MSPKLDTPAANAVSHGLTAKKLLPADLAAAVAEFRSALFAQLAPTNVRDEILVSQMAHHAAAMQMASSAEAAALRTGENNAAAFEQLTDIHGDDVRYLAALSNNMVERIARYRRGHERSFSAVLNRLTTPQSSLENTEFVGLFVNEDQCDEYLTCWQKQQKKWRCPRCQSKKRSWIDSRHAFECSGCKKQFSNRFETIYAKSRVPLLAWFVVVEKVIANPYIASKELTGALAVTRQATVEMLIRKAKAALASAHSDQLLAGVNRLVADRFATWAKCSQPGAAAKTKKPA